MKRLLVLLMLVVASPILAQEITVVYSVREPLINKTDIGVDGTVGKISADVIKAAGFTPVFKELPLARQLIIIEENESAVCGLNYFERAARLKIGVFSKAVSYDQPIGVLTTASNKAVLSHKTFTNLTGDTSLKFARKIETSYGPYLDDLIKLNNTKVVESVEENSSRVRQIGLARADYMFMQHHEFIYIANNEKLDISSFVHVQMTDAPPINKRHLFCSFKTKEYMDRIDRAIDSLVKPQ